jgi:hypothetical protein
MDTITGQLLKKSITPVCVMKPPFLADMQEYFFFMGSCFSEYLYKHLKKHLFHCCTSPCGNTYNPLSVASGLDMLCRDHMIGEDEVFQYLGLFRHFAFHTKACMPDKDAFLAAINRRIDAARAFLRKTGVLVITLGTAYAYIYGKTGCVVNNCHKLPASDFKRTLVGRDEIADTLGKTLEALKKKLPRLLTVITLSPVRHLRDRADENSLSKAVLRCAIQDLLSLPDTWYFPAYEIMLDELRDYRYYADDLCHPSDTAAGYIMDRFCESCLTEEAQRFINEVARLRKALDHRPLHTQTDLYNTFKEGLEKRLAALRKQYPMLPIAFSIEEWKETDI